MSLLCLFAYVTCNSAQLNYLANFTKWLRVWLWTKWFWVWIQLQSLKILPICTGLVIIHITSYYWWRGLKQCEHWNLQLWQQNYVVVYLLHRQSSHYRTLPFLGLTMFSLVRKLQWCWLLGFIRKSHRLDVQIFLQHYWLSLWDVSN